MTFKARPKDVWKEEHSGGSVRRGRVGRKGREHRVKQMSRVLEARREWLSKGTDGI